MFRKGKIIVSVLLFLLGVLGIVTPIEAAKPAHAEGEMPLRLDFSNPETVRQGEAIYFYINGRNVKSLAALTFSFNYPTDAFYLSWTSQYWIEDAYYNVNSSTEGQVTYSVVSMADEGINSTEMTFLEICLFARENAEIGAYRFELNIGEAYDNSLNPISIPSPHHYVKVEERNVTPNLQTLYLDAWTTSYEDGRASMSLYGYSCYDVSAFRLSIVYDKSVLSYSDFNFPYELSNNAIYSINTDTEGVIVLSYASTTGHNVATMDFFFTFKRDFVGSLSFYASMDDVYDSSNNPVKCDPIERNLTIQSKNAKFFVQKVVTSEEEFYVDLTISANSSVAAADLGLRYDPWLLKVSGIEYKTDSGEMISFDRRHEDEGLLPFSYINVFGLETEKVLARVYFRVLQPFCSFGTAIETYVEHCVNIKFQYINLDTGYYGVTYTFALNSLVLIPSWAEEENITSNRAFYILKGEHFDLKINGKKVSHENYFTGNSRFSFKEDGIYAEQNTLVAVNLAEKISFSSWANASVTADAYAKRAQNYAKRLAVNLGEDDIHTTSFTPEQTAILKTLMKEYASYPGEVRLYVDPALCKDGLNVGEVMAILRIRLNTAPKVYQSKLNFIVGMGKTYVAKIDATDDEDVLTYTIPALPSIGTAVIDEDGVFTFRGNRGIYGSEEFSIVISDGTTNVLLPVKVVVTDNSAPEAPLEKRIQLSEYSSYRGKIDAFDPDGDALSYLVSLYPAHGTLELDLETGIFIYTPEWGYFGYDSFAVDIDDGNHEITQHYYAEIAENKTPKGESLSFSVRRGEEYVGTFLANDPEGEPMTFTIFDYPSEGSLLVFDNGGFLYKPLSFATSEDHFSVKVSDGHTFSVLNAIISIVW